MVWQYILMNNKLGTPMLCTEAPNSAALYKAGPWSGFPPVVVPKPIPGPPGAGYRTCISEGYSKLSYTYQHQVSDWKRNS